MNIQRTKRLDRIFAMQTQKRNKRYFKRKSCILTIIEIKSRYAMMKLLPNRKSKTVHNALVSELKKFPNYFCKTITYDNGSENILHEKTNKILNIKSYFCKQYHYWEKGGV